MFPKNRKQHISQTFGEKAVYYNQHALLQKTIAQKLATFLPQLKKAKILEIGCGTGFLTQHLINTYPDSQLVITDLSENMLKICARNSPSHQESKFLVLDGENIPIKFLQQFDLVISSMTFQWFNDPIAALHKLQKVLKPDGQLLYSTLAPSCFPEWRQTLGDLSLPLGLITMPLLPSQLHKDRIKVSYKTAFDFLKEMKALGTAIPTQSYRPLSTGQLQKALTHLDSTYNSSLTWHITYGRLDSTTSALLLCDKASSPRTILR